MPASLTQTEANCILAQRPDVRAAWNSVGVTDPVSIIQRWFSAGRKAGTPDASFEGDPTIDALLLHYGCRSVSGGITAGVTQDQAACYMAQRPDIEAMWVKGGWSSSPGYYLTILEEWFRQAPEGQKYGTLGALLQSVGCGASSSSGGTGGSGGGTTGGSGSTGGGSTPATQPVNSLINWVDKNRVPAAIAAGAAILLLVKVR